MKKIILIGATLIVLGLLAALTIPVLAHGSDSGTPVSTNDNAWEDMYQACQNGDWEAMTEVASQVHSEGYNNMPCYEDYNGTLEENSTTSSAGWSEMGSYMGGGMMGW